MIIMAAFHEPPYKYQSFGCLNMYSRHSKLKCELQWAYRPYCWQNDTLNECSITLDASKFGWLRNWERNKTNKAALERRRLRNASVITGTPSNHNHGLMISEGPSFVALSPSSFAIVLDGSSPLCTATSIDAEGTVELHVQVDWLHVEDVLAFPYSNIMWRVKRLKKSVCLWHLKLLWSSSWLCM